MLSVQFSMRFEFLLVDKFVNIDDSLGCEAKTGCDIIVKPTRLIESQWRILYLCFATNQTLLQIILTLDYP